MLIESDEISGFDSPGIDRIISSGLLEPAVT